jgi:hypothetical protein
VLYSLHVQGFLHPRVDFSDPIENLVLCILRYILRCSVVAMPLLAHVWLPIWSITGEMTSEKKLKDSSVSATPKVSGIDPRLWELPYLVASAVSFLSVHDHSLFARACKNFRLISLSPLAWGPELRINLLGATEKKEGELWPNIYVSRSLDAAMQHKVQRLYIRCAPPAISCWVFFFVNSLPPFFLARF